jgi:hypothetical protein
MILFLTGNILPILFFFVVLIFIAIGLIFIVVNYLVKNDVRFIWKFLLYLFFSILFCVLLLTNLDYTIKIFF